jgi:hypothetical protein
MFGFLIFMTWFILGTSGFFYWWSHEWSTNNFPIGIMILEGLVLGPFTWIVGAFIHGGK